MIARLIISAALTASSPFVGWLFFVTLPLSLFFLASYIGGVERLERERLERHDGR